MKLKIFKNKNKLSLMGLLLVLLVGGYLRLWRISEYMTFLGDEGRDVLIAKEIIQGIGELLRGDFSSAATHLTLLGPTASVGGFFLGPIYYYFMVPFLWLFRLDPTGPAVMVALFGVATIFLVYLVGREFWGEVAGLTASSLYALSPLVIAYSRSSWNPNLVPFFSLLYVCSLFKAVKTSHKWWFFLVGICVGVGLQLHYLFTFLIPVGIVFFFLFGRSFKKLRGYLFAFLGFLIAFSPFLAFELRHGFPNSQTIIRFIFFGKETGFVSYRVKEILGDILFRLFARLIFHFPPPEQLYRFSQNTLFWWRGAVYLAIIFSLINLIIRTIKLRRRWEVLLLVWFVFALGLFTFYQRAIYDYYLGIMFPLPFLLVGAFFSSFWRKKILRPLVLVSFFSLVILNWSGRPFRYPPNRQLEQAKKVAAFVLEKAEGKPFNFALITGQNSDHAYRYFLEIWGRKPVRIENFANDPQRRTVTGQLLVVCEIPDCKPLGHPLWEIAGFGRAEIAGEWQVGVLKVFKLVHYKE